MPLNVADEQRALLAALATANIHLVFAWRTTPSDWRVERVQMQGDLPDDFRELAKTTTKDLASNRTEVAPYNPEWPLKANEYFHLDNARSGGRAPIAGNLFPLVDDFGNAAWYGTRRRSSPNLYVIVAQLTDGRLAMFGRRITGRNILSAEKGILTIWNQETFSRLRESVVTFDAGIDWIDLDGSFVVLNASNFHATFRDVQQLRAAVAGYVAEITQRITIIGEADFVARCQSNVAMASKLQSVVEQELYKKPIAVLQEYSGKYPGLDVRWVGNQLEFDGSLKGQWSILKLFDEAGYTGGLSGDKFEAGAKRKL